MPRPLAAETAQETLIRLSCGTEPADDLQAGISAALDATA
jgi:cystathionine beta-lyase/cystathionine gamma-synthase